MQGEPSARSWLLRRGMPDNIHLRGLVDIHCALVAAAAGGPELAFAGAELVMTWYELGLERTEEFGMSWCASVRAGVLRQRFRKMQHLAAQKRDGHMAGSSGFAGPLCRPCCENYPLGSFRSLSLKVGRQRREDGRRSGSKTGGGIGGESKEEGIESGREKRTLQQRFELSLDSWG